MELTPSQRELALATILRLRDLTAPAIRLDQDLPVEQMIFNLIGQLLVRRTAEREHVHRLRFALAAQHLIDLSLFIQGRPYALYEKRSDGYVRLITFEEMCRWVTRYFEGEDRSPMDLDIDKRTYWVHSNFTRYGWGE